MPKPIKSSDQKKIRDWFKTHGHDKTKIDSKKITTDEELKQTVLELHGVTAEQLEQAKH